MIQLSQSSSCLQNFKEKISLISDTSKKQRGGEEMNKNGGFIVNPNHQYYTSVCIGGRLIS